MGAEEYLQESLQQLKAARGEAEGQCEHCLAFRLDGKPPTVHRSWCPVLKVPPKEKDRDAAS